MYNICLARTSAWCIYKCIIFFLLTNIRIFVMECKIFVRILRIVFINFDIKYKNIYVYEAIFSLTMRINLTFIWKNYYVTKTRVIYTLIAIYWIWNSSTRLRGCQPWIENHFSRALTLYFCRNTNKTGRDIYKISTIETAWMQMTILNNPTTWRVDIIFYNARHAPLVYL